jgi:hypothetical protein
MTIANNNNNGQKKLCSGSPVHVLVVNSSKSRLKLFIVQVISAIADVQNEAKY